MSTPLEQSYFNHYVRVAEGYWERRDFVHKWWRIYSGDPYWVPPYYPALRRELEPGRNPHLARLSPLYLSVEALPKPRQGSYATELERPVAAALFTRDGRRQDKACYLTLLHAVNDRASLRYSLDAAAEALSLQGYGSLIGPMGLSPHLGSGALLSHWNLLPPLYTPYNPPYLPELLASVLEPVAESYLYHLERGAAVLEKRGHARLAPLEPERLKSGLLPLFATACPTYAGAPPPDDEEVTFILRWLGRFPLLGWLAELDEKPAGFVLLQGDHASLLRRGWGGRPLWGRSWLKRASRIQLRQGRLLFGAVLPEYRGKGVGSQLLARALEAFATISIGPLPQDAFAAGWLERRGAALEQRYRVYRGEHR